MARSIVRIIYKSGAAIDVECDNFAVNKAGGELRSVEWSNPSPRPLLFGVDEVAAIYDLGTDALG